MSVPVPADAVWFADANEPFESDLPPGIRFVVVRFGDDQYIVVEMNAIRGESGTWGEVALRRGTTPAPHEPVQTGGSVSKARLSRAEDGQLVVLVPGQRSAPRPTPTPTPTRSAAGAPSSRGFDEGGGCTAAATSLDGDDNLRDLVFENDHVDRWESWSPMSAAMPEPEAAPPPPELPSESVATTFNADFEDHDRGQPLALHQPYVLAFYAGRPDANASASVSGNVVFGEGEREATLTIHVTSADFTIEQPSQNLLVKRDGTSRGKARFDVTPTRQGRCTLAAILLKDGNFVQKIELEVNVDVAGDTIATMTSTGRSFTTDETIQARDLVLVVEQTSDGGIEIIAAQQHSAPLHGRSDMTAAGLADLVAGLRDTLKDLIKEKWEKGSKHAAYDAIEISPAIHAETLAALAEESFAMFRSIFFESGADDGMKSIGRLLASLTGGPTRDIQVVTSRFVIPWQLLYAALSLEPLDARHFLGFSHRIEHLALKSGWDVRQSEIRHTADLRISVNVNREIDKDFKITAVAEQLKFFGDLAAGGHVRIEIRDTLAGVKQALADPQLDDQVIYLYCHAVSNSAGEGVGKSALLFEGKKALTLSALRAAAAVDAPPYRGAPLVFINACQSAELSPLFYDGFVPHLTSRGARGVIGTECDTPATFGSKWAEAFFREFLEGEELGQVMLTLRRRFLEENHNLLGLLYAVHCNGNTRVDPAVGLTAS
jgi:hypothetical protein